MSLINQIDNIKIDKKLNNYLKHLIIPTFYFQFHQNRPLKIGPQVFLIFQKKHINENSIYYKIQLGKGMKQSSEVKKGKDVATVVAPSIATVKMLVLLKYCI